MLGSNERLGRPCQNTSNTDSSRSISNMSQSSDFSTSIRSSTSVAVEVATAEECSTNTGSEIQKHLQSMFFLLRPEETLKMV